MHRSWTVAVAVPPRCPNRQPGRWCHSLKSGLDVGHRKSPCWLLQPPITRAGQPNLDVNSVSRHYSWNRQKKKSPNAQQSTNQQDGFIATDTRKVNGANIKRIKTIGSAASWIVRLIAQLFSSDADFSVWTWGETKLDLHAGCVRKQVDRTPCCCFFQRDRQARYYYSRRMNINKTYYKKKEIAIIKKGHHNRGREEKETKSSSGMNPPRMIIICLRK